MLGKAPAPLGAGAFDRAWRLGLAVQEAVPLLPEDQGTAEKQ